ncbi:MAG: hypothetical protein ACOCTP_02865 [Roseicyclus sp.]
MNNSIPCPPSPWKARNWPKLSGFLRRVSIRDAACAAVVVLAASVVHADEEFQDWIPEVLDFPEDTEVVTDRAIGSTIRLFTISTEADVDALLSDWEDALNENGFPVTQQVGELIDQSIEFTGPGIANAKILVAPVTESGRSLIEFDATLN